MNILQLAITSGIPLIKVTTDDILNVDTVLDGISGIEFALIAGIDVDIIDFEEANYTYWINPYVPAEQDYVKLYSELESHGSVLVVVNPAFDEPLMFDAGVLMPTHEIVTVFLQKYSPENIEELASALSGLSLKDIDEIVRLTQANSGSLTPRGVMSIRRLYVGQLDGLEQVNTDYSYYEPPDFLTTWMKMEKPFFLNTDTHKELVPRGMVFDGEPGLGKTEGAKFMANELGIPLYRLDIGGIMNKYIGSSEANFSKALSIIDQSAPCIVLFDEIDRMIGGGSDDGVVDRIISMMLWWLQDHSSTVLTLLTTNHLNHLPTALYREGRMDSVHTFKGITTVKRKRDFLLRKIATLGDFGDDEAYSIAENVLAKYPHPDKTISYAKLVQDAITAVKRHIIDI